MGVGCFTIISDAIVSIGISFSFIFLKPLSFENICSLQCNSAAIYLRLLDLLDFATVPVLQVQVLYSSKFKRP